MSKGRKQKLVSGDEQDAVSRKARKLVTFRAGERAAVKRKLNKRARQDAKRLDSAGAQVFPDHRQDYSPMTMYVNGSRMVGDYSINDAVGDYVSLHPTSDPSAVRAQIEQGLAELDLSQSRRG